MTQRHVRIESLTGEMSFAELCQEADAIIEGAVSEVQAGILARDQLTDRQIVYTDAIVEVGTCLKGPDWLRRVTVRRLGGETPQLAMEVPDAPQLAPNERVLVFLSRDSGNYFPLDREDLYVIHGWALGKFSLSDGFAISPVNHETVSIGTLKAEIAKNLENGQR